MLLRVVPPSDEDALPINVDGCYAHREENKMPLLLTMTGQYVPEDSILVFMFICQEKSPNWIVILFKEMAPYNLSFQKIMVY